MDKQVNSCDTSGCEGKHRISGDPQGGSCDPSGEVREACREKASALNCEMPFGEVSEEEGKGENDVENLSPK